MRESQESQKTRESQESQNPQGTQPKIGRIPALITAVAIVGVAIGAAAGLLTLMLYGVEHLTLGYVENSQESGPFNVPAIRRLISVTAGAVIAAVIWWLLRTRSTKVPSVKKAVNGDIMPIWQTVVHVLLQIFMSVRACRSVEKWRRASWVRCSVNGSHVGCVSMRKTPVC